MWYCFDSYIYPHGRAAGRVATTTKDRGFGSLRIIPFFEDREPDIPCIILLSHHNIVLFPKRRNIGTRPDGVQGRGCTVHPPKPDPCKSCIDSYHENAWQACSGLQGSLCLRSRYGHLHFPECITKQRGGAALAAMSMPFILGTGISPN